MNARKSIYSGSWYPGSRKACEQEIAAFLIEGYGKKVTGKNLIGGIVPHAGWFFSGSIACNVIEAIFHPDSKPDVAVIFGMHLSQNSKPYIMAEGSWETPFGELEIASDLANKLIGQFDFVVETGGHFITDNTIELQLPFIKYFSGKTKILPVGAPPSSLSLDIANTIIKEANASGLKSAVIGSTDLTHYGPNYGFTPFGTGEKALEWVRDKNDANIINKIIELDPKAVIQESLANQNACCGGAAAAAITAAKAMGATQADLLTYQTSYDKSPGQSFVGYAGLVFG
ncbi:MAG: AmmeMemoRadiSam system protein B [Proteobacteria bacterium]|nr:AmmeMemoRadiSam system protein B [Pseudomonadota bacterium]